MNFLHKLPKNQSVFDKPLKDSQILKKLPLRLEQSTRLEILFLVLAEFILYHAIYKFFQIIPGLFFRNFDIIAAFYIINSFNIWLLSKYRNTITNFTQKFKSPKI